MESSTLGRIGFRSSHSCLLLAAVLAFAPEVAAQTPSTPPTAAPEPSSPDLPPAPPPVEAAGGSTVTLPRSGLSLVLPPSSGSWRIQVSPANANADLLKSLGGGVSDPKVEIELNLMAGLTCRTMMNLVMALKTLPGAEVVKKPTYLPTDFQAFGALELPINGQPGVTACSETPQGALMGRVRHDGASIHSLDRELVGAILTGASRTAGASELAPIADPPPLPVTLPVSGLEIELPAADTDWTVEARTLESGQRADLIDRTSPKRPLLSVKVLLNRDPMKVCKRGDELQPDQGVVVNRPSYLTDEWSQAVVEEEMGDSVRLAHVCGNMAGGGVVLVQVIYGSSLRDRDLHDVKPVLSALARAARVGQAVTDDSGYRASSPSYSGSNSGSSSSYDLDDDDGASLSRWEIGAFQLSPDDPTLDESLGALLALDMLSADPDEVVSFALHGGVAIGFDSTSNIPFDGRGSLGIGLSLGPVLLVPLVGAGLDTAGGGDEGSYRIPFSWYWDVEGRLYLELGDELALDASALRAKRNSGPPEDETRLSAHVSKSFGGERLWSLGLRYVNYGDAKLIGASLGSTL